MFEITVGHTLQELLPNGQFVLVFFETNGLFKTCVIVSGQFEKEGEDWWDVFTVGFTSEFIHDGEEENDFVTLIEKEIGIILDLGHKLFVLSYNIVNFIVVLELFSLHLFIIFFYLAIIDGSLKVSTLLSFLYQSNCIVHYFFFLPEL